MVNKIKMMNKRNFLNDYFLLRGFKATETQVSEYFGDYFQIYSNGTIDIRLISDKSIESIDIRSSADENNWYDLTLIKAFIDNDNNLMRVLTIEESCVFLQQNISIINNLFNINLYLTTKKELEKLSKMRANQMFPKK